MRAENPGPIREYLNKHDLSSGVLLSIGLFVVARLVSDPLPIPEEFKAAAVEIALGAGPAYVGFRFLSDLTHGASPRDSLELRTDIED